MRPVRASLALGLALLLTGCASWSNRRPGDSVIKPPTGVVKDSRVPVAADLVRYLNQNSANLNSIDCDELDIDCIAQGRKTPGLVGDLICQKPRNFRLTGRVLSVQQVDFGSNAERFWFWVKQSPDQALYHCAYTDFDKGVQLPFPFNPDWVVQALGMADYGKDDKDLSRFSLEVKPTTYELIENTTLQGRPVKKVTVFNRVNVAPPKPQVIAHVVRGADDKIICTATIKEVRPAKTTGANDWPIVYPRRITLEWPAEQLSLTLTLDRVKVNEPIPPQEARSLFSLPNWKQYKSIDLAQELRAAPTSRVQQAGGIVYR